MNAVTRFGRLLGGSAAALLGVGTAVAQSPVVPPPAGLPVIQRPAAPPALTTPSADQLAAPATPSATPTSQPPAPATVSSPPATSVLTADPVKYPTVRLAELAEGDAAAELTRDATAALRRIDPHR